MACVLGTPEKFSLSTSALGSPKQPHKSVSSKTSTAAMATVSPLLIPAAAAPPLVTPPRHCALPSEDKERMLPDGAVPRVSEDDIKPPYASDGGELAQVKRDLRDAMRRADRAEAAAAANKAVAVDLATTVHGATRRERERRAAAARAAEERAARARALRYDALEEPFLGL